MNSIQRSQPGNGILHAAVYYDEKPEKGTGRFVTQIEPGELKRRSQLATFVGNEVVRCAIGIHPEEGRVIMLLGGANAVREMRQVFHLGTPDGNANTLVFEARFEGWKITGMTLNGAPLELDGA